MAPLLHGRAADSFMASRGSLAAHICGFSIPPQGAIICTMRFVMMISLCAVSAASQSLSFGVKAGIPLTGLVDGNAREGAFNSVTNRYLIGPTIEVATPCGISIEVDAIYRHFRWAWSQHNAFAANMSRTVANDWEFPCFSNIDSGNRPFGRMWMGESLGIG